MKTTVSFIGKLEKDIREIVSVREKSNPYINVVITTNFKRTGFGITGEKPIVEEFVKIAELKGRYI